MKKLRREDILGKMWIPSIKYLLPLRFILFIIIASVTLLLFSSAKFDNPQVVQIISSDDKVMVLPDTSIQRYFPLKIGNSWTYKYWESSYSGNSYVKYKKSITDTITFAGHKYYKMVYSSGNYYFLRVDSLNGNLLLYTSNNACPWLINQQLVDSLASRKNDTCSANCSASRTICRDTSFVYFFGSQYKIKEFFALGPNTNITRYIYSLGTSYIYIHVTAGGHSYTTIDSLLGCSINGTVFGDTSLSLGITQISSEVPERFALFQNYPNPFNPSTKIQYQITNSGFVILRVYDIMGREIATLVNKKHGPGTYEADFNASDLPSGVYVYVLRGGEYSESRKMVLVK